MNQDEHDLNSYTREIVSILERFSKLASIDTDREAYDTAIAIGVELQRAACERNALDSKRNWSRLKRYVNDSLPWYQDFTEKWYDIEEGVDAIFSKKKWKVR